MAAPVRLALGCPRRGGLMPPSIASSASRAQAVAAAVNSLAGPDRTIPVDELEVAVLARNGARRTFERIEDDDLAVLLADG